MSVTWQWYVASMVAIVCGVWLGVRVAIPQVKRSHSADSGGKAESFGAEQEVT